MFYKHYLHLQNGNQSLFLNARQWRKLFTTTLCSSISPQLGQLLLSSLCPQLLLCLLSGDPGANLNCSPLFGTICLETPVLKHRVLMNITAEPDPDAAVQECWVLRCRARPREGRGLPETMKPCRTIPSTILLCMGTLCDKLFVTFYGSAYVLFFMLSRHLKKVHVLWLLFSLKEEGILTPATAWLKLEDTTLVKLSQTPKRQILYDFT